MWPRSPLMGRRILEIEAWTAYLSRCRATGYVGRMLGGIGTSDPGGSTPAPPPPAAALDGAAADGGEIGSTSAIKARLPIGLSHRDGSFTQVPTITRRSLLPRN